MNGSNGFSLFAESFEFSETGTENNSRCKCWDVDEEIVHMAEKKLVHRIHFYFCMLSNSVSLFNGRLTGRKKLRDKAINSVSHTHEGYVGFIA